MDWAFPNKSAGPPVLILSLFLGPFLPLFAVRGGDSIASCFLLGLPHVSHDMGDDDDTGLLQLRTAPSTHLP